jgi:hypothetical protein
MQKIGIPGMNAKKISSDDPSDKLAFSHATAFSFGGSILVSSWGKADSSSRVHWRVREHNGDGYLDSTVVPGIQRRCWLSRYDGVEF